MLLIFALWHVTILQIQKQKTKTRTRWGPSSNFLNCYKCLLTAFKLTLQHSNSLRLLYTLNWFKGTNGRQKTYEVFHVYCIFYSGFMSQTTVIFGITKDGSLESNNLASWNCFTCRNLFQNGANDMSECLTFETAFCKKSSKFCIVRIIRFRSNFASLW